MKKPINPRKGGSKTVPAKPAKPKKEDK